METENKIKKEHPIMKTPIMGFFAPKCTIKGLIGFLCVEG
jgi:hypothetical protein